MVKKTKISEEDLLWERNLIAAQARIEKKHESAQRKQEILDNLKKGVEEFFYAVGIFFLIGFSTVGIYFFIFRMSGDVFGSIIPATVLSLMLFILSKRGE